MLFSVLIGAVDAGIAAANLNTGLRAVRSKLQQVEEHLTNGEIVLAQRAAKEARDASGETVDAATRPSLSLAALIPELDRDARTLRSLAGATDDAAEAAGHAVQAAALLDLGERGVPHGLYEDGQIVLETAAEARESIGLAERAALEGALKLEGLDPRLALLQAPLDEVRDRISDAISRLNGAGLAFDLTNSFFGGHGQREYLMLFQSPGEARATGGFVGFFGVLSTDNGNLELEEALPVGEIQLRFRQPVQAPEWFKEAYAIQGALTEWQQANVSPNFPASAEVYLNMYEKATGKNLDGVLTMDPFALGALMEVTGPIQTRNPQRTIAPSEVAETILHDSYVDMTEEEQDRFLTDLIERFWLALDEGDVDLQGLAEAVDETVTNQHVKIYSRTSEDQQALASLGLHGNYDGSGGLTQMAFNNNYAANKIDYYLQREIRTKIELQRDRSARVTTTLVLENNAPSGPPSLLIGQGKDVPVGTNRMMLNLLMPPASAVEKLKVAGESREPFTFTDDGSPVAWQLVELPAGETETVVVEYSIPNALQLLAEDEVFDFTLYPQTTVNPDRFSLEVIPPPGSRLSAVAGTDGQQGGRFTSSGVLEAPFDVRLVLEPTV